MENENMYLVIFDAEKLVTDGFVCCSNRRTFQRANDPQDAVNKVAAEYNGKGYRICNIQVFQRIMNRDSFFWSPSEESR